MHTEFNKRHKGISFCGIHIWYNHLYESKSFRISFGKNCFKMYDLLEVSNNKGHRIILFNRLFHY